ncbi:MAG: hypothetical protein JNL32_00170 [Candidatus Kapabacteria bacterium]|nr:hypothetical protein [Candidatus Kapabacteria bacterium]
MTEHSNISSISTRGSWILTSISIVFSFFSEASTARLFVMVVADTTTINEHSIANIAHVVAIITGVISVLFTLRKWNIMEHRQKENSINEKGTDDE